MLRPGDEPSAAVPRGYRGYVAVMFSDLSDSTELGGWMEGEHYALMLVRMRSVCEAIILRHGGVIARMQGDGLLAVFGLPEPREDDGRRAAEAALDMHAAVARMVFDSDGTSPGALALHSGIHAGLTYLQDGRQEAGALEVLGDVPNTAARLSSLARRDEILVSAETLGAEVNFFETSEPRLEQLKGRASPLVVYRILDRAAVNRRFDARAVRGLVPFVGRDAERRRLEACRAAAASGTAQCVAVLGSPGIGKTRLIEEVMQSARRAGDAVLHGYCESYLGAEPLQAFVQVLRGVLGVEPGMPTAEAVARAEATIAALPGLAAADGAGLLRELSLAARGDAGARGEPRALVALCIRTFDALAAQRPLLLVLDDWQWADELSQRVLDGVLGLRRPICAVLASRADEAGADLLPRQALRVELSPLDPVATHRTIEHLLPGADPITVADIHQYAGGVPLFIEELCHAMVAGRPDLPPGYRPARTAWLAALVGSRVDRLPDALQRIVRAAAVIGNVFPGWLLERITGHGEASSLVRALAGHDLIYPAEHAGMLRFKHGVTRDVVYDAVGLHERREIHRQVAQALRERGTEAEQDYLLEALAYQYAAGGLHDEAAQFAEAAGDKALAASALDRARAHYVAALAGLDAVHGTQPVSRDQARRWCVIAEKLGMACVFDPLALVDGIALFERGLAMARHSGDATATARAHYWLGYIHYALGRQTRAIEHGRAALDLANRVADERLAAQVRATLGQALQTVGDYEAALALIDTALSAKRARGKPGSGIAVGSAFSLACKGGMLADRGHFSQAHECFAEAQALLGDSSHQVASSVINWISLVHQWQGRWDDAVRVAEASVRVAESCKSRQLLAFSRTLWGRSRWMAGDRVGGFQALLDATTWIEARRGALMTSLNYGFLVDCSVAQGRADHARRHAARLLLCARRRDMLGVAMGCRALALLAATQRDFERADHDLAWAERAAQARDSAHERAVNRLCGAEIAIERGRGDEARRLLDEASAGFEGLAMAWHLGQAERLRARV